MAFVGRGVHLLLQDGQAQHRCAAAPIEVNPLVSAGAAVLDRFSFPSGHTLHAIAFSLVACAYYPELWILLVPFTAVDRGVARRARPALSERRDRRRGARRADRRRLLRHRLNRCGGAEYRLQLGDHAAPSRAPALRAARSRPAGGHARGIAGQRRGLRGECAAASPYGTSKPLSPWRIISPRRRRSRTPPPPARWPSPRA